MSNLRILRLTFIAIASILFLSTLLKCSSFLQLKKLKNCQFRLERIEAMNVEGIDINHIHSLNDLGIINASKILQKLSNGSLQSELTVIISVNNPNESLAAMEKFEYSVLLDANEIVTGSLNSRIEIPANKKIEFPLSAKIDISKLLKQNSISALLEIANSFSTESTNQKRIRIKVKPYIRIGNKLLKYPGFVEIKINEWSQ
jgi:LEA14-like dessication related protein